MKDMKEERYVPGVAVPPAAKARKRLVVVGGAALDIGGQLFRPGDEITVPVEAGQLEWFKSVGHVAEK